MEGVDDLEADQQQQKNSSNTSTLEGSLLGQDACQLQIVVDRWRLVYKLLTGGPESVQNMLPSIWNPVSPESQQVHLSPHGLKNKETQFFPKLSFLTYF